MDRTAEVDRILSTKMSLEEAKEAILKLFKDQWDPRVTDEDEFFYTILGYRASENNLVDQSNITLENRKWGKTHLEVIQNNFHSFTLQAQKREAKIFASIYPNL